MTDNTAQKTSAVYRLPALDQEFLLGDSMRGVRLLLEYEKAEEQLRAWMVRSTIVVFGSARVRPADSNVLTLESDKSLVRWYEVAQRFGRLASERWSSRPGFTRKRTTLNAVMIFPFIKGHWW